MSESKPVKWNNIRDNISELEDDQFDIDLAQINKIKKAQLVLKKALEEEHEAEFIEAVIKAEGWTDKTADIAPMFLSQPNLMARYADMAFDMYPDYHQEVESQIEGRDWRSILESAQYSPEEVELFSKADKDFKETLSVTSIHEQAFGFKAPNLSNRLKDAKTDLLKVVGNENFQKGLKVAGLALGCLTGGIVVTAGIKASKLLANRVAEAPGFQSFVAGMSESATNIASKITGQTPEAIREKTQERKNAFGRFFGSPWVKAGAAVALVGVATMLAVSPTELSSTFMEGVSVLENMEPVQGFGDYGQLHGSVGWVEPGTDPADLESIAQSITRERIAGHSVSGLPSIEGMDNPEVEATAVAELPEAATYTVKSGDNLWNIAKFHLESAGLPVDNKSVLEATQTLYQANIEIVGSNMDLIHPGQELEIPDFSGKDPEVSIHALDVEVDKAAPTITNPTYESYSFDELVRRFEGSALTADAAAAPVIEVAESAAKKGSRDIGGLDF